jgi:hypothetical protein
MDRSETECRTTWLCGYDYLGNVEVRGMGKLALLIGLALMLGACGAAVDFAKYAVHSCEQKQC